jgi:hypothetical protein
MTNPLKSIVRFFVASSAIIFAFVIEGCKEDECQGYRDTITVVEAGTYSPVANAEVTLLRAGLTSSSIITTVMTDEHGKADWPCTLHVDEICAEAPDYYGYCGFSGLMVDDRDIDRGFYFMKPKSWLKIIHMDDDPLNPNEFLIFQGGYDDGISYQTPDGQLYTIVEWIGEADHVLTINHRTFENGQYNIVKSTDITFNVPHLDTLEYAYHY